METGRLCGAADGLENALAASFCIKKSCKNILTKLAPTRRLAWVAFLELGLGGNRDIGFGGVYLWILCKFYRHEGNGSGSSWHIPEQAGMRTSCNVRVSRCLWEQLCQAMAWNETPRPGITNVVLRELLALFPLWVGCRSPRKNPVKSSVVLAGLVTPRLAQISRGSRWR